MDLTNASEQELRSEIARRNSRKRKTIGRGGGRHKTPVRCEGCGVQFAGKTEYRKHKCGGKNAGNI